MIKITNFIELIEPHLGLTDKSIKIASYSTKPLVPVGENYGSVILAVEIVFTNGKTKQLVAKLNPPSEVLKKLFNISIAFKKEAEFYSIIVPILHNFQKQHDVEILDSFAKSYGHRLSLSSDTNIFNDDACFVMENVQFQGFVKSKRTELFDLLTAKYIIKTLAHFHALPIAIKIKKPEEFNKIKSHLQLNLTDSDLERDFSKNIWDLVNSVILEDKETAPLADKINKLFQHSLTEYINMNVLGREPFNTITHNDVWLANILLKLDDTGKAIGNRLVDYQMAAYGNPGNDILFFIHSSTKTEVISEHYDQLIDIYFEEYIQKLKDYKVDTKQFTKEAFLGEITDAAKNVKLYHILFMMVPVFMKVKDDTTSETLLEENLVSAVTPEYAKHLKAIIMNWVKHKWL